MRHFLSAVCLFASVPLACWAVPGRAQVIPDQTLGAESSIVIPNIQLQGAQADLIEGGATRGTNLFHSFSEFNVGLGQQVYFANPIDIKSILSRVTGNNPSDIFGTLGVDGNADLFLINPNGIVFGPDVSLDVDGSFYATTAEAVEVGNGLFSAIAPEQSQLLAISPSVSFWNYLTANSGDITNRGQLVAGETLLLAGQNLDLTAQLAGLSNVSLLATDAIKVRDTAETPFIAAAGADLLVQGNNQVDIVALGHPDSQLYSSGDMVLRSTNAVHGDTHFFTGGNFRIENLDNTLGNLTSPIDPIIRSLGDVEFDSYSGSSLHIIAGGSVKFDAATITAPDSGTLGVDFLQESLDLSDGTTVDVNGGAQPTIDIRAGVKPESIGVLPIQNPSGLNLLSDAFVNNFSEFQPANPEIKADVSSADIEIGSIQFFAPDGLVLLTNQYEPNTSVLSGDIRINGGDPFGIGVDIGINTVPFFGNGGPVFLDSRNNISVIDTTITTRGTGTVGDVSLLADGAVLLQGQGPLTRAGILTDVTSGPGTGGDIKVVSDTLTLLNGARLNSSVFSSGVAGNIILNIEGDIQLDGPGTGIFNSVESFAVSNVINESGTINISAENLDITNRATVSNSISSNGIGKDLVIDVQDTISLNNGGTIFSSIGIGGAGQAGDIQISADNLDIRDDLQSLFTSQISTSLNGVGTAGDITIDITDTVNLRDLASGIFSSINLLGRGQGGDISLTAKNLNIVDGALFNTSSGGSGDAGDVTLVIDNDIRIENLSRIASNALSASNPGAGGDIQITADSLSLKNQAALSAVSQGQGDSGNITLDIQENLQLQDSSVSTDSDLSAGGQIDINAGNIFLFGDSDLQTFVNSGIDNGGDITITADALVAFDDSDILAFAQGGSGGDVDLSRTAFFGENFQFAPPGTDPTTLDNNDRVDINATGGIAPGTISLADVSFIENSITDLPDELANPETLVANSCIARSDDTNNSFVATGSGGLPAQPSDDITTPFSLDAVRPTVDNSEETDSSIIEPSGIYQLANGRLVMTQPCQ